MKTVTLKFKHEEQAKVFIEWFKQYGFDQLCESDMVHDDLDSEIFYQEMVDSNKESTILIK